MRRFLLPLLLLLLLSSPCWASPAWVQSDGVFSNATAGTSQTDTLTHTSTAGNDLLVAVSWKAAAGIVNYVCGGTSCTQSSFTGFFVPYTTPIPTGSSNASQIWICHMCAATSVITVHWSASTVSTTIVDEYSGVSAIGQVTSSCTPVAGNCTLANSANPTVTITIQDANNIVAMVSSSLGSDGVPTANTGNLRGATRSGTTSSFNAGSECDNTSASAGTAVTCKVTITSSAWTAIGIELRGATAPTTDFIESHGSNAIGQQETTGTINNITDLMVSDPIISGNTVLCALSWPFSVGQTVTLTTQTTFTGAAVDTFTKDKQVDGSVNSSAIFRVAATANTQYLHIVFGTGLASNAQLAVAHNCSEFKNITTSSPVDNSSGTASEAGPTLSPGNMTTLSGNDIVFTSAYPDSLLNGSNQGTGYCAAGNGMTHTTANVVVGYCGEYGIVTASSINPSLYLPTNSNAAYNVGTNSFNVVSVAYKIGSSGSSPTGEYVSHFTMEYSGAGTFFIYTNCPSSGTWSSGIASFGQFNGGMFDSNQVAYTKNQPAANMGELYYSVNSTLDSSSMCMYWHTDANTQEFPIRDITDVKTSAPLDTMSSACPAPSTFATNACYNTNAGPVSGSQAHLPDIQPTNAGEIVLTTLSLGTGPTSLLSAPSGAILDCPYYTGMTDVDKGCAGGGHGHFLTTGAGSAENWTWTLVNSSTGNSGTSWALLPIPAAPPSIIPRRGPGIF